MNAQAASWSWEIATDADEVHALLCLSDTHQSQAYGLPLPGRRYESTQKYIEAGEVQLLRDHGSAVGMFTLTWQPTFAVDIFPSRQKPAYLRRLAVRPDYFLQSPLIGARCLRRAIEVASDAGADALRAEANPDLEATDMLLHLFGFVQYGATLTDGKLRRIYLEKHLEVAYARDRGLT